MAVEFRVIIPVIATILIIIGIIMIITRRAMIHRRSSRTCRRVHSPNSCATATYSVPGCEGVSTRSAYPPVQMVPPHSPFQFQSYQPTLYPQQQFPTPTSIYAPQSPSNPYVHRAPPPPPTYQEAQHKI
ncbi:hypothetical protein M3Y98_00112100 [Aphelenchoides besseyi]|nr:hypothetical protein M3Y98_00112100 [Aphelenchoides besseyi]KAI6199422.1 hypothetical protein M3Y96_00625400 [Aphelenchoides besseyi]